ncbi:YsnF/AvaK domain-containing protein [Massilia pseudoviolaceinigra]|uniref:YsnF/AvaK domain-containing protein n=1 Tax=Massilia pseudoviolaceinigra TaxID=3057165 RepID=UPI0027968800|nr:YsnF/AvaK domain-containing protein [Massilia sp. CCM 9206]MDQ1923378.1 YsnF/AvaK domain-containing protein [Massilia sp. CCM 9206]
MATDCPEAPGEPDGDTLIVALHREELQVGTRVVDTGRGVRIHKTVSEHPHHIDETLLYDELDVRHVIVDKIVPLSQAPSARQEGDTLIVPVVEEVLVTERRLRIKEEVHITRIQRSRTQSGTVMLRAEDVVVERFDEGPHKEANSTIRR